MDKERMANMAERIAGQARRGADEDVAMENVDQALDAMVAAVQALDENLPLVKTDSVPQRAALDAAKEVLETGVQPYLSDLIK